MKHQPFDAYSKRSLSLVRSADGSERWVTKGAPQVILALCKTDQQYESAYKVRFPFYLSFLSRRLTL